MNSNAYFCACNTIPHLEQDAEHRPNRGKVNHLIVVMQHQKYLTQQDKLCKTRAVFGTSFTVMSKAPLSFSLLNHRLAPSAAVTLFSEHVPHPS
jgi:hypothetical protein